MNPRKSSSLWGSLDKDIEGHRGSDPCAEELRDAEVVIGMCLMWLSLTKRVQLPQVLGPEHFFLLSSPSQQLQRLAQPKAKNLKKGFNHEKTQRPRAVHMSDKPLPNLFLSSFKKKASHGLHFPFPVRKPKMQFSGHTSVCKL